MPSDQAGAGVSSKMRRVAGSGKQSSKRLSSAKRGDVLSLKCKARIDRMIKQRFRKSPRRW